MCNMLTLDVILYSGQQILKKKIYQELEEINILFKLEEITATWLLRTLNLGYND